MAWNQDFGEGANQSSGSSQSAWRDNFNGGWAAGDWTGNHNARIASDMSYTRDGGAYSDGNAIRGGVAAVAFYAPAQYRAKATGVAYGIYGPGLGVVSNAPTRNEVRTGSDGKKVVVQVQAPVATVGPGKPVVAAAPVVPTVGPGMPVAATAPQVPTVGPGNPKPVAQKPVSGRPASGKIKLQAGYKESATSGVVGGFEWMANPGWSDVEEFWEPRYGEPGEWMGGIVNSGVDVGHNGRRLYDHVISNTPPQVQFQPGGGAWITEGVTEWWNAANSPFGPDKPIAGYSRGGF